MGKEPAVAIAFESAIHPGELVAEYLELLDWPQSELARRTGLTPKTISEIRNGKSPITPPTALAFEKVLQRPAHFWLNLQRQHDEALARARSLELSAGWRDWATRFPLAELRKWGFIRGASGAGDVDALLTYFGVSSPESWSAVWQATPVVYRQTRTAMTSAEAVSAWVRATEIEAADLRVGEFDEGRLRSLIPDIRSSTRLRVQEGLNRVQVLCAQVGVAVVWVPALRGTGVSGCARWLSSSRAMIAVSLRYKTDDQMWFTFFHELGHLLLHGGAKLFIVDNPDDDLNGRDVDPVMQRREEEANRFAADTMIPPEPLNLLLRGHQHVDNDALRDFSESIGIAPGIVVGRLQHEGILKHWQGNAFKQRLDYGIVPEPDSE